VITRLLLVLFALLAVIGWADVERPILRLATGRDDVRVVVVVQPHSDHRALLASGTVWQENDDGELVDVWSRTSGVQLDGDRAPKSHTFRWTLPKSGGAIGTRTLRVQAAVVCASAEGAAFLP
jgi:phage-related tail fiber protein